MLLPENTAIFTVTRLNTTVRQLLELEMGRIWISAEISNFSRPSSGHWYFTLKDEKSQVRAAMFRGNNSRVTFAPQNGQQVLVRAAITLYEPRGDYQLIVESMQPAGEGLLQQQFELLKEKLKAEGLFDTHLKKPLPVPATCVGVVTSATGAALHDILNILRRRDPSLPVIIYPAQVQGADAPAQIVRAIETANRRNECDVLIVGRGGGSLEDLWSFNDERVARAIFASRLPVISAVGHETDITIADFVADLRAPTPSAAAELVSRDLTERLRQIQSVQQRLEMAMDYFIARKQRLFSQLLHRLQQQHPQLRLARQQQLIQRLEQRLIQAGQLMLTQKSRQLTQAEQRLMRRDPRPQLQQQQRHVQQLQYRLSSAMREQLSQQRERFARLCSTLEGVSPLATLSRGFSISQTDSGEVLNKTRQVKVGQKITTLLQDGSVESEIIAVHKKAAARKRKAAE